MTGRRGPRWRTAPIDRRGSSGASSFGNSHAAALASAGAAAVMPGLDQRASFTRAGAAAKSDAMLSRVALVATMEHARTISPSGGAPAAANGPAIAPARGVAMRRGPAARAGRAGWRLPRRRAWGRTLGRGPAGGGRRPRRPEIVSAMRRGSARCGIPKPRIRRPRPWRCAASAFGRQWLASQPRGTARHPYDARGARA